MQLTRITRWTETCNDRQTDSGLSGVCDDPLTYVMNITWFFDPPGRGHVTGRGSACRLQQKMKPHSVSDHRTVHIVRYRLIDRFRSGKVYWYDRTHKIWRYEQKLLSGKVN